MVVEDDDSLCKLIAAKLGAQGLEPVCFRTAESAREALTQRRYAAIVLDLVLPDRSGLYVVETVRTLGLNPRPPIVMITASGGGVLRVMDRTYVKAILFKPFEVESLVALVASLVRGGGARG